MANDLVKKPIPILIGYLGTTRNILTMFDQLKKSWKIKSLLIITK
jgi:hypothetical protein